MSGPVTPEALVDAILQPLGTKLANYVPVHRERAVMVAATYLRAERAADTIDALAEALRGLQLAFPRVPMTDEQAAAYSKASAALAKAGLQ